MKPLPSTSQVRKNSLVLSSRAIRPQSEPLLPGFIPKPFTLPSSSMSGTLFSSTPVCTVSGVYFSGNQEWNQTSGLLTGPAPSALGLLQSPWRQRQEAASDDEPADNFVAYTYTQNCFQAPVRRREITQTALLIKDWERWNLEGKTLHKWSEH